MHILILIDDGIADDKHAVIRDAVDEIANFRKPAVFAQRVEVFADVRLKNVEMTIDQLRRTERHLIGKMDFAAVRLDRVTLERDLAGNVALRILVILTLDINRWADALDSADGVGGIVDRHPIDIFERRKHLGPQLAIEHRPSRPLVDEAICSDRNDEHVAKFAGGLQVTNMAQVEEIECSVRLYDDLTGAAALFTDRSDFRHGPDLVPRAYRAVDARLADQLCDA